MLRSPASAIGLVVLTIVVLGCLLTLPWTTGSASRTAGPSASKASGGAVGGAGAGQTSSPRYDVQERSARHLPPTWWIQPGESATGPGEESAAGRYAATTRQRALARIAGERTPSVRVEDLVAQGVEPTREQLDAARPMFVMGTDLLGRDVLVRCLAGGGVSLTIGVSAALISVFLGTMYGTIAGYCGGRVDSVMMRVVDVLYGLPYVLLVVLLAVAVDALFERAQAGLSESARQARASFVEREIAKLDPMVRIEPATRRAIESRAMVALGSGELSPATRQTVSLLTLLVSIGGVSWLTMARVVRGQVLSLKAQPFMEAARAIGVPIWGQFTRHLLPNLIGPITVYATLTVPQAILQESFLSFLGIGVKPPLPSWGNLAADGLSELNPYRSHWWLLLFPCAMLGVTLLALNLVGEGLREAIDPKRRARGKGDDLAAGVKR